MITNGRIDIYNPDTLTKHIINDLIDMGKRFDVIPGLEEEEYSEIPESIRSGGIGEDKQYKEQSVSGSRF